MARIEFQNYKTKRHFKKFIRRINKQREVSTDRDRNLKIRLKYMRKIIQGHLGEFRVRLFLLLFLSRKYTVINNVCIEVNPNDFIQIDHLVIGRNGIFVVETKSWRGNYHCDKDSWNYVDDYSKRKAVANPIYQQERHLSLIKTYLKRVLSSSKYNEVKHHFTGVIILLKGKINQYTKNPNFETRRGAMAGAIYIRNQVGSNNISDSTRDDISKAICDAQPLDHLEWMNNNFDFEDVRAVRIKGTFDEARSLRSTYISKGYTASKIKTSYGENTHAFSVTPNERYFYLNDEKPPIYKRFAFKPVINRKAVITFFVILLIYSNYGTIRNTFLDVKSSILQSSAKLANSLNSDDENEKQSNEVDNINNVVMTFEVKLKKDVGTGVTGTYISIEDNGSHLFKPGLYEEGTKFIFYNDKKVILEQNGELIEKYVEGDILEIEVANSHTIITHGENTYRGLGYFDYNFTTNEIDDY
ncbi:nuclease-related domain-containing protein [Sporosalibacterium faouarense]|uniref:nuclease-related domain-containing protein n=1 Tax=Sporosalibacterium faouarense TaxID=516123 RepID=UPI00192B5EF0|nr:nuclease-related domain-containing protein [Sporosalibacterium faouarense]